MESARGHYEINVRNTGDHISDFDSGRRMVYVWELSAGLTLFIFSCPCHKVRSTYTSHVTRPSDKVTRTWDRGLQHQSTRGEVGISRRNLLPVAPTNPSNPTGRPHTSRPRPRGVPEKFSTVTWTRSHGDRNLSYFRQRVQGDSRRGLGVAYRHCS